MLYFKGYHRNDSYPIKVGYNDPNQIVKLLLTNPFKLIDTDYKYYSHEHLTYIINDLKTIKYNDLKISESQQQVNKYSVVDSQSKLFTIYLGDGRREAVKLGISTCYKKKMLFRVYRT